MTYTNPQGVTFTASTPETETILELAAALEPAAEPVTECPHCKEADPSLCECAPSPETPLTLHIAEYRITQHYGGPEEGGWYYDWYTFIRPVVTFDDVTDDEQVYAACRALNAALPKSSRHLVNDVDGDMTYCVDRRLGDHTTTERPYYC